MAHAKYTASPMQLSWLALRFGAAMMVFANDRARNSTLSVPGAMPLSDGSGGVHQIVPGANVFIPHPKDLALLLLDELASLANDVLE